MRRDLRATWTQGFTLIELLVAVSIILMLAALAVMFMPNVAAQANEANAAALLQNWLNVAKQKALRDQSPRGLRLLLDYTTTTAAFVQPAVGATVTITVASTTNTAGNSLVLPPGPGPTPGQILYVQDKGVAPFPNTNVHKGYFQVTQVNHSTSKITMTNLGAASSSAPGSLFKVGAVVTPKTISNAEYIEQPDPFTLYDGTSGQLVVCSPTASELAADPVLGSTTAATKVVFNIPVNGAGLQGGAGATNAPVQAGDYLEFLNTGTVHQISTVINDCVLGINAPGAPALLSNMIMNTTYKQPAAGSAIVGSITVNNPNNTSSAIAVTSGQLIFIGASGPPGRFCGGFYTVGSAAPPNINNVLSNVVYQPTELNSVAAPFHTMPFRNRVDAPAPITLPLITAYRFIRAARPTGDEPLQVSGGVVIDLMTNDFYSVLSALVPLPTSPLSLNPFFTASGALATSISADIMFAPSGSIVNSGSTTGRIDLWVRSPDSLNPTNYFAGTPSLVSSMVNGGFVGAYVPDNSNPTNPYDLLR
jgi:prepilin-type N-terminal cleavage/methylation domain-containing protein